jgi:hypothetical protein
MFLNSLDKAYEAREQQDDNGKLDFDTELIVLIMRKAAAGNVAFDQPPDHRGAPPSRYEWHAEQQKPGGVLGAWACATGLSGLGFAVWQK